MKQRNRRQQRQHKERQRTGVVETPVFRYDVTLHLKPNQQGKYPPRKG